MNNIEAFQQAIKEEKLLNKYDLEKIGIFGSFARGENANDIDFYIDKDDFSIQKLVNLKKDLEKITNKEIDIMIKKYANPIILYRAEKDMVYVTQ
jgi:predicted nucleotidyltransferase